MTDFTDTLALRAFIGSCERRGVWNVPPRIDANVMIGYMELDLRNANLGPTTRIDVDVTLGALQILVPDDVVVDVEVDAFAGGVDSGADHTPRPDPAMPGVRRLRVTGRVRFGGCDIVRNEQHHDVVDQDAHEECDA
jgi:hypothetical protein